MDIGSYTDSQAANTSGMTISYDNEGNTLYHLLLIAEQVSGKVTFYVGSPSSSCLLEHGQDIDKRKERAGEQQRR